jgi:hypothetical protein
VNIRLTVTRQDGTCLYDGEYSSHCDTAGLTIAVYAMAKLIEPGHAMKMQYDLALDDRLENSASGLCNLVLHKLFPSTDFIITGQYYFEKARFYADYVVEMVWSNGRRAIILVVEVKPGIQSEEQDAKSDDQAEDYGRAALNQDHSQKLVYAARFIGGECMFYWVSRTHPTLNPLSTDFMDMESHYAAIRGHVATMKRTNLFA